MEINEPETNYQTGWIKIFRSVKKHWLFPKTKPLTNFEAWILILIEVNHSGEKVQLGYDFYECKRGEKLYSLDTWAKLFNWNKSKVRRFFALLEKDSMIVLKNEQKTTRLTVLNYDVYQSERNASETQVKRKRHQYKNDKNEKNINREKIYKKEKFNFKKELENLDVNPYIISDWLEVRRKKRAANTETAFNKLKNEIEKSGLPANECIKIAAENSWQGFKAEWLENQKQKTNGKNGFNSDVTKQTIANLMYRVEQKA